MVYSYEEAVQYILNIPKFTSKNPMENTRHFMKCLGNPQDQAKTIHVAGTNGKGSVCAILAKILLENGKTVGMFTSPHLVRVNERIRIDGMELSDEEFTEIFTSVLCEVQRMEQEGYDHPTFFEFLYGMAMVAFCRKKVEYYIVEAGMGGRNDTTNVVRHPAVTIITAVGKDHMEYLGAELAQIAYEKAGIIKENVPLIYVGTEDIVSRVVEEEAALRTQKITKITKDSYKILKKEKNHIDFSTVYSYDGYDVFQVPFLADYQVENAVVALHALLYLEDIPVHDVKRALQHVLWEGRMEPIADGIILDGAHNEPGITEFVKTAEQYPCEGKKYLLFSTVYDKDYQNMIAYIAGHTHFSEIYVTEIKGKRCLQAETIQREFQRHTTVPVHAYADNEAAWKAACQKRTSRDVLFCTGSLYLVGNIKGIIRRTQND